MAELTEPTTGGTFVALVPPVRGVVSVRLCARIPEGARFGAGTSARPVRVWHASGALTPLVHGHRRRDNDSDALNSGTRTLRSTSREDN